jgi:hypothetical protein
MKKYIAVLLASLCLLLAGCDGVKDEDRNELDEIGTKTEKEQLQIAKDIKKRVDDEFESKLHGKTETERAKAKLPEHDHLFRLQAAVTEVEENGIVSKKALKRVKAALPFAKAISPSNEGLFGRIEQYDRAIELASKEK